MAKYTKVGHGWAAKHPKYDPNKKYPMFNEIHTNVDKIFSKEGQAYVDKVEYDYVIDCRGFPKDYSDYIITPNIYVNAGIVFDSLKPSKWDYSYHIAHKNGWMFGLPLSNKVSFGYLYNSKLTTKQECLIDLEEDNYKINYHHHQNLL